MNGYYYYYNHEEDYAFVGDTNNRLVETNCNGILASKDDTFFHIHDSGQTISLLFIHRAFVVVPIELSASLHFLGVRCAASCSALSCLAMN